MRYGGVELGGTKVVCAVGRGPGELEAEARFPTTTPAETLERALAFLRDQHRVSPLTALGIATFGPVELNPASPAWGRLAATPKGHWAGTELVCPFQRALSVPVALDTDVNAAALAEGRWGAARGVGDFVYLTVGTGIGGGAWSHGRPLHGLLHPEMGHLRVPHAPDDLYAGCCPFHGDCWEGLASGPALQERWGQAPERLPADHPAWDLEARYLALGVVNVICALCPQRIVMGGGVMQQAHLFPQVRRRVQRLLNGYFRSEELRGRIGDYIVPPALGTRAGVLGALALAQRLHPEP